MQPSRFSDEGMDVTWRATTGLIRFRQGDPEEGRALYLRAIDQADQAGLGFHKAMAACNLAQEELLARTDHAREAVQLALAASESRKEHSIALLKERLLKARDQIGLETR
jgi:hypothetical protein